MRKLIRLVSPGTSAARHVAWYIRYQASGGTLTRP